jgi:hypothetical protein
MRVPRPQGIIETPADVFAEEEDARILSVGDSTIAKPWVTLQDEAPAHPKQSIKHRCLAPMMERENQQSAACREQFVAKFAWWSNSSPRRAAPMRGWARTTAAASRPAAAARATSSSSDSTFS